MKKLRIITQVFFFLLISVSFFLLSFPFKFGEADEFFVTSPSLMFLTAISSNSYSLFHFVLTLVVVAFFLAIAFLFGRVFCGWVCPFGAIMDFVAFIAKPFRKWKEHEPSKDVRSKYYLLLAFVVLAVLGFQFVWFFEPITVYSRFFYLALFPALNSFSDSFFQYLIMNHNVGENLYSFVQNTLFDAKQISFNHSLIFFFLFIIPVLLVLYKRRFWCRYICPLGASLGLASIKPIFGFKLNQCSTACGRCKNLCPTNAIRQNATKINSECIMCQNCKDLKCRKPVSPSSSSHLPPCGEGTMKDKVLNRGLGVCSGGNNDKGGQPLLSGISRKQFLLWTGGILSTLFVIFKKNYTPLSKSKDHKKGHIIRPPGAVKGDDFKKACARCGNCMKVCITNGLQPVGLESGLDGIWTPKIDPMIGYCEYECNACGQVCPTQAIQRLELDEKKKQVMGTAEIQKDICIPWATGVACLVCEEMCPIPEKAIKFVPQIIKGKTVNVPVVKRSFCVGCSICQNKCPVEGKNKGILVG